VIHSLLHHLNLFRSKLDVILILATTEKAKANASHLWLRHPLSKIKLSMMKDQN